MTSIESHRTEGPVADGRTITVPARDGYALAATLFEPPSGATDAAVVIHPATAVLQRLYRRFAAFLAAQGFAVLTYDYRGIGASRPKSLRGFQASARDWGEKDMAGVIDWVAAELKPARQLAVAHSIGGQLLGHVDTGRRVQAALLVAAQSGYYRLWPWRGRLRMNPMVHIFMPAAAHLFGRFPSRLFGLGEDLPKGVALEWARWCRNPHYMVDERGKPLRGHAKFTAPILAMSFTDDSFAPDRAVAELLSWYGSPRIERRHIRPADAGLPAIGHFGFFRLDPDTPLWRESADWLKAQG